jgi:hypothetical protein
MTESLETQRTQDFARERGAGQFQPRPDKVRIELRYVSGCANVDAARSLLRACLGELGLEANVTEVEGDFPSPTIRVNGADVMGAVNSEGAFCRLDVPTRERLMAALEMTR